MSWPEEAAVRQLEAKLDHRFAATSRIGDALTHASYANEHPGTPHHEALAFLGDAALALVVAERLLAETPDATVGTLTPQRAQLVSGSNLARWAADLELGAMLRLGRGEALTGGRGRESILATALEAVLGVVYLEDGLEAVRRVVARLAGWSPSRC